MKYFYLAIKSICSGFFVLLLLLSACSDEIDKRDRYTFKGLTVADYINSQKDLSMFSQIMSRSYNASNSRNTVATLLGTRGHYTVFVPTNEAVKTYLYSIYGTKAYNIDTISEETANRIVLNCIMDFGNNEAFRQTDLYEGALTESTINDRHLIIHFGDFGDGSFVKINGTSRIIEGDLECTNGYIHIVDQVIKPAPNTLPGLMETIGNIRIFTHLLEMTGWEDSLISFRDRSYVRPGESYPQYRIHGYMAFTETDEVFHKDWGIPLPVTNKENGGVANWEEIEYSIAKKCQEAYPAATEKDFKSMGNAVNQFVSYHLIPFKQPFDKLVSTNHIRGYSQDCEKIGVERINIWNYFQTMGKPNRLLKITETAVDGIKHLNRHSFYDNTFCGTYKETSCDIEGITIHGDNGVWENYCVNGYYYPIDNILLYDEKVKNVVLNERIRYNFTQNLPEVISNNLQFSTTNNLTDNYCDNLILRNGCTMAASPTTAGGVIYGYGQIRFQTTDFTAKLMSVPFPGKWEVRITYPSNHNLDNKSTIIFRKFFGTHPHSVTGMTYKGELQVTNTDLMNIEKDEDLGYDSVLCLENDKLLLQSYHLRKGPKVCGEVRKKSIISKDGMQQTINIWRDSRWYPALYRYTFCQEYMEPNKEYYIRLQGLTNPKTKNYYECTPYMVELVPENVYNNPDKAEDPW